MADLINFSNGIRGARIDPLLCGNQSKKLVPEARARRNSFSSKENSNVASQEENSSSASTSVVGRKHLSNDFEKAHCNGVNQTTETRRKSNPDCYMKQTTQERVSLGKKKTNNIDTSAGVSAAMDETHKQQPATSTSATPMVPSKIDHFQKSSIVPEQGASPKKGGLRFMAGPPEFVADSYVPKKLHTHAVGDARAKNCTVGGLMKQQQENFSVASSSVSASVVRPRANNSSATYNIITGQ